MHQAFIKKESRYKEGNEKCDGSSTVKYADIHQVVIKCISDTVQRERERERERKRRKHQKPEIPL